MRRSLRLQGTVAVVLLVVVLLASPLAMAREITVWLAWLEEPQKEWLVNKYFPSFEAKTGIKVNWIEMPGDEETLRAQLIAGKGPDVVGLAGPSFVPLYIDAGFLKPLDEYAEKYRWKDLMVDLYWQLGHYKGKFYTIPQEFEAMVLFYNPRIFRENGWTPPRTLAEMEELAAKMKEKGIMPFANGNVGWKPAIEWIFTAAVNSIAGPEKVYRALKGE
ncbi:MAG: extracellular solute-binding protein, partial [Candidatus Caldatribacterium sp.]|nr:extracellular solute-binding protein [Candidatus Caldatribacterium sp.]